jgi:hypothetical protein
VNRIVSQSGKITEAASSEETGVSTINNYNVNFNRVVLPIFHALADLDLASNGETGNTLGQQITSDAFFSKAV